MTLTRLENKELVMKSVVGIACVLLFATCPALVTAGSTTPVGVAPWVTNMADAQELALKSNKMIFCYFTRIGCPHCTTFEKGTLASERIEEVADKVVWLYHYTSAFDNRPTAEKSEVLRQADRSAYRLSVAFYPRLFILDPETLQPVSSASRGLEGFLKQISETKREKPAASQEVWVRKYEEMANELELRPSLELAKRYFAEDDLAVKMRAIEYLKENEPEFLLKRIDALLAVEGDPCRRAACDLLSEHPDGKYAPALNKLFENPINSDGFGSRASMVSVMRIKIGLTLSKMGNAESIDVLGENLKRRDWHNYLTKQSPKYMMEILQRHPECKPKVIEYFVQAFPRAPIPGKNGPSPGAMESWLKAKPGMTEEDIIEIHDTQASQKALRIGGDLIRRLNTLTDKSVAIPDVYTEATREEIVEAFGGGS